MKLTVDDLRGALHDEADTATHPDVDAMMAGARRRFAATRQRRLQTLGATTLAVLLVGGLLVTLGSTHKAVPQPADTGPYTVVHDGAGFPEYAGGMRRIAVLEAPVQARMKGSISLLTNPGQQLGMKMNCDSTQKSNLGGEWTNQMVAHVTAPLVQWDGRCALGGVAGPEMSSIPVEGIGPATGTTTTLTINAAPAVAAPKGARIHLAIYQSLPWDEYVFPQRPARMAPWPPSPGPREGMIWHSDGSENPVGPRTVADANKALNIGWDYDPRRVIRLEVRGPGRLRVIVDGYDVTTEVAGASMVRDGDLTFWDYSSRRSMDFPLDPRLAARGGAAITPARPGAQVWLTVIPEGFSGPDWRITYLSTNQMAAIAAQ